MFKHQTLPIRSPTMVLSKTHAVVSAFLCLGFVRLAGASTKLISLNITVPEGTQHRGDLRLICLPSSALSMITFFVGNYFAHAATVLIRPGAPPAEQAYVVIMALACPASGLVYASTVISHFVFRKSLLADLLLWCHQILGISKPHDDGVSRARRDLHTAARAGAICTLVRTRNWRPQSFTGNTELLTIGGCFIVNRQQESSSSAGLQSQLLFLMIWKLTWLKKRVQRIRIPFLSKSSVLPPAIPQTTMGMLPTIALHLEKLTLLTIGQTSLSQQIRRNGK